MQIMNPSKVPTLVAMVQARFLCSEVLLSVGISKTVPVPYLTGANHLIVPLECKSNDFGCDPHQNNISVAVGEGTSSLEIIAKLVSMRSCRSWIQIRSLRWLQWCKLDFCVQI